MFHTCGRTLHFSLLFTLHIRAGSRTMASNSQPPSERASEIINNMPSSPGLLTKTGSVVLGTGLAAAAISQELFVVNEETVIAAGFLLVAGFIGKVHISRSYSRFAVAC